MVYLVRGVGLGKYELRKQRIVWEWGRQKMKQFEILKKIKKIVFDK